jgi:hypothetical protein
MRHVLQLGAGGVQGWAESYRQGSDRSPGAAAGVYDPWSMDGVPLRKEARSRKSNFREIIQPRKSWEF